MSETTTRDYGLSEEEALEFNRRLAVVRARLHSLNLKREEKDTSPEAIINCLYVLVQEPMLVFLYKEISGELRFVRYHDHKRALQGRRGIKLIDETGAQLIDETDVTKSLPIDQEHRLFRVFGTCYYLRIFRYKDDDQSADFIETSLWAADAKGLTGASKQAVAADNDFRRYISLSTEALLGSSDIYRVSNESQRGALGTFVTEVFGARNSNPIEPQNGNSNRLVPRNVKKEVEALAAELRVEFLSKDAGLDRVQQHSKRAARQIKMLANEVGANDSTYPNMMWFFRTFDRSKSERSIGAENGERAPGYDYNLQFVLTEGQYADVANYLRSYYVMYLEKEERYGDWLTDAKEQIVRALAKELDAYFWARFSDCENDNAQIIDFLKSIIDVPYGQGAVSFADTVFHGGLIQVRTPFRRFAGLDRVKVVFDANEKNHKLTIDQLSEEQLVDCLRVVAIYYLQCGCGQTRAQTRNRYRTRVVLFPISVYQVTVGVIGCVVLEHHGTGDKRQSQDVPRRLGAEPSNQWNMVYHFYRDVYTPVQRDIRRLYRDIQVILLRKRMAMRTWDVLVEALATKKISGSKMRTMAEELTMFGNLLARFIPYPAIQFVFTTQTHSQSATEAIKFDDLFQLNISNETENPYFRLRRALAVEKEVSFGVMNLHVAQMRLQEVFQTQISQYVVTREAWDQAANVPKN